MFHAIETNGLIKTFGTTRALNGVDLRIRKGSVFGLLGPNGAGKTTTIRILGTLLRPDAGSADQCARARELVTRALGQEVLPVNDPTALTARLATRAGRR